MEAFFLLLLVALYFLPTTIAALRGHNNTLPIFLVNLLLGWAFGVGWVVALIWSCTSNTKSARQQADAERADAIAAAVNKVQKEKDERNPSN